LNSCCVSVGDHEATANSTAVNASSSIPSPPSECQQACDGTSRAAEHSGGVERKVEVPDKPTKKGLFRSDFVSSAGDSNASILPVSESCITVNDWACEDNSSSINALSDVIAVVSVLDGLDT
jgi:hypothetical protein